MTHRIAWPTELGHLIRLRRDALGLSTRELAQRLSCGIDLLTAIELGEAPNADLELIDRIARELKLDPIEVASHTGSLFRSMGGDGRIYFRRRTPTRVLAMDSRGPG